MTEAPEVQVSYTVDSAAPDVESVAHAGVQGCRLTIRNKDRPGREEPINLSIQKFSLLAPSLHLTDLSKATNRAAWSLFLDSGHLQHQHNYPIPPAGVLLKLRLFFAGAPALQRLRTSSTPYEDM